MQVPDEVWSEAVTWWSLNGDLSHQINPQEMKRAALAVRDRWEQDPVKRRWLEAAREQKRLERDALIQPVLEQKRKEVRAIGP
ncbi:hypothetical protein CHEID_02300 [Corynebacterium heidelbergense]|nr:hypothetical protein CHEID_02300 [Corynebacterium heidelbergense]